MSLVTILGSLHSTVKTRACGAFFLQIIVFLEPTRWLMGSTESWSDFDVRFNSHFISFFLNCLQAIRHSIKLNTVDKLKQILTGFNDECGTHHNRSGKKQDLIDRATSSLDQWHSTKEDDKWSKAKNVIAQVRSTGMYVCFSEIHLAIDACVPVKIIYLSVSSGKHILIYSPRYSPPSNPMVSSSTSASNLSMHSLYHANNIVKPNYQSPNSGPSVLPRYDPYAPPRRPVALPATSTSSSALQKPAGMVICITVSVL